MTTAALRIINPTLVKSSVTFVDPEGLATDPATVTVTWIKPDGTKVEFVYGINSEVVRAGTGVYGCQLVTNMVGGWSVTWQGENVATGFVNFRVGSSSLS